jgi:uncharacterized protein
MAWQGSAMRVPEMAQRNVSLAGDEFGLHDLGDDCIMTSRRPVAPNLFTTTPELRLLGGRHRESGRLVFPLPADSTAFEPFALPSRGTLWSYTIQRFPPKSPPYRGTEPFVPFALGYVELPDALIVESRLTDVEFDALHIGLPMELTTVPLRTEPDGAVVLTYAFRPVRSRPS